MKVQIADYEDYRNYILPILRKKMDERLKQEDEEFRARILKKRSYRGDSVQGFPKEAQSLADNGYKCISN